MDCDDFDLGSGISRHVPARYEREWLLDLGGDQGGGRLDGLDQRLEFGLGLG